MLILSPFPNSVSNRVLASRNFRYLRQITSLSNFILFSPAFPPLIPVLSTKNIKTPAIMVYERVFKEQSHVQEE